MNRDEKIGEKRKGVLYECTYVGLRERRDSL